MIAVPDVLWQALSALRVILPLSVLGSNTEVAYCPDDRTNSWESVCQDSVVVHCGQAALADGPHAFSVEDAQVVAQSTVVVTEGTLNDVPDWRSGSAIVIEQQCCCKVALLWRYGPGCVTAGALMSFQKQTQRELAQQRPRHGAV
jgi:hypothetical protein